MVSCCRTSILFLFRMINEDTIDILARDSYKGGAIKGEVDNSNFGDYLFGEWEVADCV